MPIAFDPSKGLVFAAPWDVPRIQQLAPTKPMVIGEGYTGVNARQPTIDPGQVVGYYIAMDPLTGERKWEVPLTGMPAWGDPNLGNSDSQTWALCRSFVICPRLRPTRRPKR